MPTLPLPIAVIVFLAGLAITVKGADWLVSGSSSFARTIGVSELMIGLTVVAFGTSLPELTVNVFSSLQGANDLAVGNIVGSNIANILLILGIAAVVAPLTVKTSSVWKEIPLSFLAALVLLTMANDRVVDGYPVSELSRSDGLTLIAFFLIFLWYTFGMQRSADDGNDGDTGRYRPMRVLTLIGGGLALLIIGGKLTVDAAVTIASAAGLSQAFIGLTLVAVGTSVPELATSVVAARRGKADIAVGNIVGSNIFNIFWILGVSASIRPLVFASSMNVDLGVALLATALLFLAVHTGGLHRRLLFWRQRHGHIISKGEGAVMLACYAAYIGYLAWRG